MLWSRQTKEEEAKLIYGPLKAGAVLAHGEQIADILRPEDWRRTGSSPTRSGPKGSSRNEFGSGRCPVFHFMGIREGQRRLMPEETQEPNQDDQAQSAPYRVLARKYRPNRFSELIGQEPMVRTLRNAIDHGRLAHAFILTGVRGVGKTTTARLIAKALNCVGPDGTGGLTPEPCGQCEQCMAISESRNVDVIEMDAASRTGVDDIREIIDGVRYAPGAARYKVYIIDEVHMLSRNAFNALLKTLEEPPEHVIFIFATTEIRKVPVTVLSRCQRFDLRRIESPVLVTHLARIADEEGVKATEDALSMIARAAEGSVRDALSILDQAIAHGGDEVSAEQVRDLLGLADRQQTFELFQALMAGDVPQALEKLRGQYDEGADPSVILQDLLDVTHWVTQLKMAPEAADRPGIPELERNFGKQLAEKLGVAHLTRGWQMLLKGLEETLRAPSPVAAAEMALIRIAYAGNLPTPAELLQNTETGSQVQVPQAPAQNTAQAQNPIQAQAQNPIQAQAPASAPQPPRESSAPTSDSRPSPPSGAAMAVSAPAGGGMGGAPQAALQEEAVTLATFEDVVALAGEHNALQLQANLVDHVHLVRFQPGRIELRLSDQAPPKLPNELGNKLTEWTGERWVVSLSSAQGAPSLKRQQDNARAQIEDEVKSDPLVAAALIAFPDARITNIETLSEETLSPPNDENDESAESDESEE